jgi:hypothetical protein
MRSFAVLAIVAVIGIGAVTLGSADADRPVVSRTVRNVDEVSSSGLLTRSAYRSAAAAVTIVDGRKFGVLRRQM